MALSVSVGAQGAKDPCAGMGVSKQLQQTACERLRLFIELQGTEKWDEVSALLGDSYQSGVLGERRRYHADQKAKVLELMRTTQLKDFHVEGITFGTWILSRPLNHREWMIDGCAVFGQGGLPQRTTFWIYRDKRQWYFTPVLPVQGGQLPYPCTSPR